MHATRRIISPQKLQLKWFRRLWHSDTTPFWTRKDRKCIF